MANNRNIQVNLTGNASNLQQALTTGQTAIQNFGTAAGGTMGNFASTFAGGLGNSATALTGFGAALGVTAGAITATFAKVQEASVKAFETMQAASLSQMGITQIQQMANMYAKVGLTMENVADQQKDVKDKIGDAITNIGGSVYTDIIQPLQLNAGALQKMADTGGDVIAKIYYQAKQMGFSESQIVNMMETIGNDATKRITVLKEYNSEQEYQNSLASQTITLTTEQATQFGEYQQATRNLSNAWEAWNNNALAPIAERLANILNLMANIISQQNKIQMPVALGGGRAGVSTSNAQSILDAEKKRAEAERTLDKGTYENMVKYGQLQVNSAEEIAQAQVLINQQKNDQIQKDNASQGNPGFSTKELDTQSQSFQSGTTKIKRQIDILDSAFKAWKANAQASLSTAYAGNIDALDKDIAAKTADYLKQRDSLSKQVTKEQDDAAAKAKSASEKAAREQANLAQKNADARAKAEQVIAKAVADTQTDAHAHQLAEFDRQQKALVDQINKAAATLGISPAELLGKQATASAANRDTLIKNQLGITKADPNAAINTQNQDIANLQASGNLSEANRQSLVQMQANRVGTTNGMIDTSSALKDNDAAMQAELQQNDLLLKGHEDYEKQKAAITAKYNAQALQISQQNTQTQLTQFADATQSLGDAVSDVFGKNSAAAKAAFIAQKAITIAQTVMNIQLALSNALAIGFPQNIPVYLQVAAMGMSIISSAKGAAGQFHGGIDDLPSTMDNKSFVLKAGERVVQPEANTKLTKFLDKQDSNGGSMGDTTVNAPLIINGSTDDDSKFDEMLKKHANNVSLAVRNAQRRNS